MCFCKKTKDCERKTKSATGGRKRKHCSVRHEKSQKQMKTLLFFEGWILLVLERLKKITEEAAKKRLGIGEKTARKGAKKTQEAVE